MVLIVSQKFKNAVTLCDVFYYMNIISYPCTPSKALNEISTIYHAVLISEPNDLPDAADFVRKLRSLAPVPIFAITNEPKLCNSPQSFDKVFTSAILSGNLAAQMMKYLKKNNLPLFGKYFYAGMDVRCTERIPKYFYNEMNLTKTERMIMCYLAAANYDGQPTANILKYAFPYNKKPSDNCVRTHISQINEKFIKLMQFRLIRLKPKIGYYLASPVDDRKETKQKPFVIPENIEWE